jgi:hypothetical protein
VANRRLPRAAVALGTPALIIVALAVLLLLVPKDRVRYELPQLEPLAVAAVDELRMRQADREVVVRRQPGAGWEVSESGAAAAGNSVASQSGARAADAARIVGLIEAAATPSFTDLVSAGDSVSRYGLDPAAGIEVTLYAAGAAVRELRVGSLASNQRGTFVQVPGDRRVYQASGDLRSGFSLPAADYRDMRVLAFDPAQVTRIEARPGGGVGEMFLERGAGGTWQRVGGDGRDGQSAELLAAIERAASLVAIRYADEPPTGQPLLTVTFHLGDDRQQLTLYPEAGNKYPATSSQREDPFFLFTWIAEQLLQAFSASS